ncbi:hypothetical protein Amn_pa03410 (plasmid) [Aminobacter sp. Y103A]|nr:hypothetical protein Amn_pa03410 [Aminobacter sp. SS-2016]
MRFLAASLQAVLVNCPTAATGAVTLNSQSRKAVTFGDLAFCGVARNQWILKGEEVDLKEIEVKAFGRRSRATVVERCAHD